MLVTGVTYRHPGLLAKIHATLDVLSGGRATLGIGAAWYEEEHRAMGVPYPPLSERFERLEETLQICRQMWDPTNDGPYDGTHYQLAQTLCSPQPLTRPEILIGGSGERKTLRLVAQYGDACNLFTSTPDEVAHKLEVLRGHCADLGRDPAEIRVTMLSRGEKLLAGDVDGFVEEMRAYDALGVESVILTPGGHQPRGLGEGRRGPRGAAAGGPGRLGARVGGRVQGRHVDLVHRQHRVHGAAGAAGVRVAQQLRAARRG